LELSSKNFKDMFSDIKLDHVNEKTFAKMTLVKVTKFENWKNYFIKGLKGLLDNVDDLIETLDGDMQKLITQEENTCNFQGRNFN